MSVYTCITVIPYYDAMVDKIGRPIRSFYV